MKSFQPKIGTDGLVLEQQYVSITRGDARMVFTRCQICTYKSSKMICNNDTVIFVINFIKS